MTEKLFCDNVSGFDEYVFIDSPMSNRLEEVQRRRKPVLPRIQPVNLMQLMG